MSYKLEIKPKKKIMTKFGTAKIPKDGYYRITSRKEGNNRKYLHRLIFEDFYGKIPKGYHIHHKDGNKLNNCIMNLQILTQSEHHSTHQKGANNSMYGKYGENHHNAKYNLWNISKCCYDKSKMIRGNREPNPYKCFYLKFKGKQIRAIGMFHDFITPQIIHNIIIKEMI